MELYRIYNRITKEFHRPDILAESALVACFKAGWPIANCWVRLKTRGSCSHGWSNVTSRRSSHPIREDREVL